MEIHRRLQMDYWLTTVCLMVLLSGTSLAQFSNQQAPQQPNFNQPQPGTFQTQPGTNQQQPGTFQTQPGTNQQQPGGVVNSPQGGIGSQQPVPTAFNPAPQQPGMTQNQPQPQQPGTTGGQMPNGQDNSQFMCATAGRSAVAQCFQQNGGFQMINVIALLSNGTQGQLPMNRDQVQAQLCNSEKQIVSCVFTSIERYNGSQQCNTIDAFIRLQQETVGLLNGIQQLCGTGIIPRVTECMRRLSYDMMACYEKVGLNPGLYAPGGSRVEGAVIGDNREAAKMFCQKRRELFSCQNRVLTDCPGAKDLQALSGNDQMSLQSGMDVLCKDVNDYVSGLVCFQQPPEGVQSCAGDLVREMTAVTTSQIRDSLSTEQFFVEYCSARIRNLRCDNQAWGGVCKAVAVGLKAEFQCSLLPARCKESTNSQVRALYQEVCTEANYARNERITSADSGATGVMVGFTSVIVSLGVALIMLV